MAKRYVFLGTALALILPLAAQAETRGFYIGGAGGADFANETKSSTGAGSNKLRYDIAPTGLVSVGYGFGAFRAEIEGSYRDNDVSRSHGAPLNGAGGHKQTWGVLVNGFYDINTGTHFTPYIGGGIGVGFVDASLTGSRPAGSGVGLYKGTDTTLAYQGIVGVAYAINDRLSITTDYRYFATTDATIKSGGAKWNVENSHHVVTAGLRWSFGAPAASVVQAAEVVPAPAPVASQSNDYLVFFDWDKSNLTPEAHAVIRQVASAANRTRTAVVLVTGNTDTSGSPAYNQKLSERRASAVKRELIKLGVAPDLIEAAGRGEDNLSVPTTDGVREPLNRRATIVLRLG